MLRAPITKINNPSKLRRMPGLFHIITLFFTFSTKYSVAKTITTPEAEQLTSCWHRKNLT